MSSRARSALISRTVAHAFLQAVVLAGTAQLRPVGVVSHTGRPQRV
jgi:hypothetical protein